MLIANGFEEIYNTLDFTDSIVECINWENDLLDLVLTVDYYNNSDEEELLKLRFRDCLRLFFNNKSFKCTRRRKTLLQFELVYNSKL